MDSAFHTNLQQLQPRNDFSDDSFDFESYDWMLQIGRALRGCNFLPGYSHLKFIFNVFENQRDVIKGSIKGIEYLQNNDTGEELVCSRFAIFKMLGLKAYVIKFFFNSTTRQLRLLEIEHGASLIRITILEKDEASSNLEPIGELEFDNKSYVLTYC